MNYIYGYRNKINDKWYIGQTTMRPEERHRTHLSGARNSKASDYNSLFHKKIREYGIENFQLEVLEEVENKEFLDEREVFWIKEKNSFVKNGQGYNLTIGGQKRKDIFEDYVDVRAKFQTQEEITAVISQIKNTDIDLVDIAQQYNVSLPLICCINTGTKYHQNGEEYPLRKIKSKTSKEQILQIIELLKQNKTNAEISALLNIDVDVIYKINYGKAHKQNNIKYPIRKQRPQNEIRADIIKILLKQNKYNNKEIAFYMSCDPSVISNINFGKSYKDKDLLYPIRVNYNKN